MRQTRRLLESLVPPRSSATPEVVDPYQELLPLARGVLRRLPQQASLGAEDLCDDLLCYLLESPETIAQLLKLDDAALAAALRKRLRWLAVEQAHAWPVRKRLQEIVAKCLDHLPRRHRDLPPALTRAGRLETDLVARAVAWLLGRQDAPARDPGVVAQRLLDLFFPGPVPAGDHPEPADARDSEEDLIRDIRVGRYLSEVPPGIRRDLRELLVKRASGATLEEIARAQGVAVATVHARLTRARLRLTQWFGRSGIGRSTAVRLLDVLIQEVLLVPPERRILPELPLPPGSSVQPR
jgi:hypothetical protein